MHKSCFVANCESSFSPEASGHVPRGWAKRRRPSPKHYGMPVGGSTELGRTIVAQNPDKTSTPYTYLLSVSPITLLYSGGPRKWYPQLWAEKILSVSVCLCHKNCLLWTIPSIPSISFFRNILFPSFVQNPSGFVLFSPFLFTIRALFVVRSPQSSPEAPQSPATCPDHPLRCAGVRAPSPKHPSPVLHPRSPRG